MKSTNSKRAKFSMEDFEQGLMLAGMISPASVGELRQREELEAYEKTLKSVKKTVYFKRAVLAAEIAWQLHEEPTFGRVKFQKLVFLCEHVAQMNLLNRYLKLVAGPFDNKFMHTIEKEFAKQNWFVVEKVSSGNITRSVYKTLPKVDNYRHYFQSYFANQAQEIHRIIDLFRTAKTDTAEIAATLFACYWELRNAGSNTSLDNLLERFYNWSEQKKRFEQVTIKMVWEMLIEHCVISAPGF